MLITSGISPSTLHESVSAADGDDRPVRHAMDAGLAATVGISATRRDSDTATLDALDALMNGEPRRLAPTAAMPDFWPSEVSLDLFHRPAQPAELAPNRNESERSDMPQPQWAIRPAYGRMDSTESQASVYSTSSSHIASSPAALSMDPAWTQLTTPWASGQVSPAILVAPGPPPTAIHSATDSATLPQPSTSSSTDIAQPAKTGRSAPRTSLACRACQHRRVRCSRSTDEEACLQCTAKGIHCVFEARASRKPRTGKRIEEARSTALTVKRPSSPVESALSTSAWTRQLHRMLLDEYFSSCELAMPIIDYTAQRALIHEAGQQTVDRPGELIVQALVAATAARASTHAIMASDAGGTRADIVAQLDRQAFDLIETHRVYTDISEMSMRTLVIAGMSDTERTSSTARCYRDMALSVMRQLPPIDSVNLDVRSETAHRRMPVVFFAILIDAIWAARDLHNLAATDDDVADLLPPGIGNIVLRPLDPIRCRASFRFAPVESQVAWSALLAAVRALVRRCSSRRARGQPSDPSTQALATECIHVVLDWLVQAEECDEQRRRSRAWQPSPVVDGRDSNSFGLARGVLGATLAILFSVAREGVHLYGGLTARDSLAFFKLCGAQTRLWTQARTKQSFRDFVEASSAIFSGGRPARVQPVEVLIGGTDWSMRTAADMFALWPPGHRPSARDVEAAVHTLYTR